MASKTMARHLRTFHLLATVAWALLIIPSVLFWKDSVPWLVAMSVWANVAGHFASWQGARTEVKHEEDAHGSAS